MVEWCAGQAEEAKEECRAWCGPLPICDVKNCRPRGMPWFFFFFFLMRFREAEEARGSTGDGFEAITIGSQTRRRWHRTMRNEAEVKRLR